MRPSTRPTNPSIVVCQPVGRTVRDSWASFTHHHMATPYNANLDRSGPPVDRHRRMKRSHRIRRQNVRLVTSDLHRHRRRAREEGREEDLILNHDVGTCGWFPRRISCSAVAGARGGGGETVPEMELLLCDAWLAGFVGLDVVGEKITPVVVGHVIDIALRAMRDTLFSDRADIVGLSVVIPGKNLLCQSPF